MHVVGSGARKAVALLSAGVSVGDAEIAASAERG